MIMIGVPIITAIKDHSLGSLCFFKFIRQTATSVAGIESELATPDQSESRILPALVSGSLIEILPLTGL